MNDLLISMIESKNPKNRDERDHAIREVLQEMILDSLAQTDFFDKASFIGGTSLRIFHKLNRFSEDLDFILKEPASDFNLGEYLEAVRRNLSAYQIEFTISVNDKERLNNIRSGTVSANTRELILSFYTNDQFVEGTQKDQLTKIKIDVDTEPAQFAKYEILTQTNYFTSSTSVCDIPTMLSGKIHAILCRGWKNRVKGRDLFDFIFLVNKDVNYNFDYLKSKMMKSGYDEKDITVENVKTILIRKFTEIDYESAKTDVKRFVNAEAARNLNFWNSEMFISICEKLKP